MGSRSDGTEVHHFLRNARFPLRPSDLAFALNSWGSILNTTGRAASRSLAVRVLQGRQQASWRTARSGTKWVVTI